MSQENKTSGQQIADRAAKIKKIIETAKAIAEAAAGNWTSLIKLLLPIIVMVVLTVFLFFALFASSLFSLFNGGKIDLSTFAAPKIQQNITDYVTDAYKEANEEIIKEINNGYKSSSLGYDETTLTIVNPLTNANIMEAEIYKIYAMFTVNKDREFILKRVNNPTMAIKDQADIYNIKDLKKMMKSKFGELLTYTVSTNTSTHQPQKFDKKTNTWVNDGSPITKCDFTYTITAADIDTVGPAIFDLADRTEDTSLPERARINEIDIARQKALTVMVALGMDFDEYGGDLDMTGLGETGQTTFVSKVDYSSYINEYSVSNISFTPDTVMAVPLGGKYKLSSPFGPRIHPVTKTKKFHTGVDLSAASGVDIHPVANGIVVKTGYTNGYGNFAIVYHGQIDGSHYFTTYNHMNTPASVSAGQVVSAATVIGQVGSTGLSTGSHLHFEVRVGTGANGEFNFVFRDPTLFLSLPK